MLYLQELNKHGVAWKFLREQFLDTCEMFKDAVLSILATLAKQERVMLSERTIAGLARARGQGRIGGRPKRVTDRQRIRDLRAGGASC
jgi:DNA invertase Pin-like site-specific DNA recombinase